MHNFFNIIRAIFIGLATGLIVALPLGPAGIESIKRTVSKSFKEGFIVSLGAVCADMAYLLIINCGFSNLLSKNRTTEAFFWIISGLILFFIGYKSINNNKTLEKNKTNYDNILSKLSSLPFLAGFAITFTNPMTPSLWLALSGTVIKAWQFNAVYYYTFIFSILAGMITWFFFLNYFALKGMKILTPSTSDKTSKLLMLVIIGIGVVFVLFGVVRLII